MIEKIVIQAEGLNNFKDHTSLLFETVLLINAITNLRDAAPPIIGKLFTFCGIRTHSFYFNFFSYDFRRLLFLLMLRCARVFQRLRKNHHVLEESLIFELDHQTGVYVFPRSLL